MSLTKRFNKNGPVCKVTFKYKIDRQNSTTRVNLAGDFNNWDIESLPMKKLKNGEFSITVDLEKGSDYQFKYLIDGNDWLNEIEADNYVTNNFYGTNSVISI